MDEPPKSKRQRGAGGATGNDGSAAGIMDTDTDGGPHHKFFDEGAKAARTDMPNFTHQAVPGSTRKRAEPTKENFSVLQQQFSPYNMNNNGQQSFHHSHNNEENNFQRQPLLFTMGTSTVKKRSPARRQGTQGYSPHHGPVQGIYPHQQSPGFLQSTQQRSHETNGWSSQPSGTNIPTPPVHGNQPPFPPPLPNLHGGPSHGHYQNMGTPERRQPSAMQASQTPHSTAKKPPLAPRTTSNQPFEIQANAPPLHCNSPTIFHSQGTSGDLRNTPGTPDCRKPPPRQASPDCRKPPPRQASPDCRKPPPQQAPKTPRSTAKKDPPKTPSSTIRGRGVAKQGLTSDHVTEIVNFLKEDGCTDGQASSTRQLFYFQPPLIPAGMTRFRVTITSFCLCGEAASGLGYIHNKKVLHYIPVGPEGDQALLTGISRLLTEGDDLTNQDTAYAIMEELEKSFFISGTSYDRVEKTLRKLQIVANKNDISGLKQAEEDRKLHLANEATSRMTFHQSVEVAKYLESGRFDTFFRSRDGVVLYIEKLRHAKAAPFNLEYMEGGVFKHFYPAGVETEGRLHEEILSFLQTQGSATPESVAQEMVRTRFICGTIESIVRSALQQHQLNVQQDHIAKQAMLNMTKGVANGLAGFLKTTATPPPYYEGQDGTQYLITDFRYNENAKFKLEFKDQNGIYKEFYPVGSAIDLQEEIMGRLDPVEKWQGDDKAYRERVVAIVESQCYICGTSISSIVDSALVKAKVETNTTGLFQIATNEAVAVSENMGETEYVELLEHFTQKVGVGKMCLNGQTSLKNGTLISTKGFSYQPNLSTELLFYDESTKSYLEVVPQGPTGDNYIVKHLRRILSDDLCRLCNELEKKECLEQLPKTLYICGNVHERMQGIIGGITHQILGQQLSQTNSQQQQMNATVVRHSQEIAKNQTSSHQDQIDSLKQELKNVSAGQAMKASKEMNLAEYWEMMNHLQRLGANVPCTKGRLELKNGAILSTDGFTYQPHFGESELKFHDKDLKKDLEVVPQGPSADDYLIRLVRRHVSDDATKLSQKEEQRKCIENICSTKLVCGSPSERMYRIINSTLLELEILPTFQKLMKRVTEGRGEYEDMLGQLQAKIQSMDMSLATKGDLHIVQEKLNRELSQTWADLKKNNADSSEKFQELKQIARHSQLPHPAWYYSKNCTINGDLRNPKKSDGVEKEANWLIASLERDRPCTATHVWRGVDARSLPRETLERLWAKDQWFYQDKAFTSTSLGSEEAWHFAAELPIDDAVPQLPPATHRLMFQIKHKTGRDISRYVHDDFKWEKEVLFAPNVKFKVRMIDFAHKLLVKGKYQNCVLIDMEEMEESAWDPTPPKIFGLPERKVSAAQAQPAVPPSAPKPAGRTPVVETVESDED